MGDLLAIRNQMSGQVNVEVDAAPQADLTKVLEEVREHYEAVAAKSRKELEIWSQAKTEAMAQEAMTTQTVMATTTSQSKEVKSQLQSIEIELQSQLSMKASLEASLSDIQSRYAMQMNGFQMTVAMLEEQLGGLRGSIELQSQDYQMLLDIKTKLEMEIAEYRRLMDGEGVGSAKMAVSSSSSLSLSSGVGLGSAGVGSLSTAVESSAGSISSTTSSTVTTVTTKVIEEVIES